METRIIDVFINQKKVRTGTWLLVIQKDTKQTLGKFSGIGRNHERTCLCLEKSDGNKLFIPVNKIFRLQVVSTDSLATALNYYFEGSGILFENGGHR